MEFNGIVALIDNRFQELFNRKAQLFSAPGRINLIGEHTDYNDGFVLPAAIDKSIVFAIYPNDIKTFRFFSFDYNIGFESSEVSITNEVPGWAKYLLGVLDQFRKNGFSISGVDCVFGGNIPIGSGLSSSAALECGFAFGLNELFGCGFSLLELVQMSQKAEHEYAGVMCGIMDQYASVFGKQDHVFRLDCRDITHEYFPIDQSEYMIVLCDTKVKHQLASSEYNQRRIECNDGVQILQQAFPEVKALGDVTPAQIRSNETMFDAITFKRCLYVAEENERVIKACSKLMAGELDDFGSLMYDSHEGLRQLYEVSCDELDFLVDLSKDMESVIGSRLMGGGFGGCTINLVNRSELDKFKTEIDSAYNNYFGRKPEFYFTDICDGVHRLA